MSWSMKKATAALLVVAAISAPAASARPLDPVRPTAVTHQAGTGVADSPVHNSTAPSADAASSASDGFDWGDAGIGAATMFTLIGLGTGTVLISRRARERRPAATN